MISCQGSSDMNQNIISLDKSETKYFSSEENKKNKINPIFYMLLYC